MPPIVYAVAAIFSAGYLSGAHSIHAGHAIVAAAKSTARGTGHAISRPFRRKKPAAPAATSAK
jgi:hypothetical protein